MLIPSESIAITTPITTTMGSSVKGPIVIVAILRAGLSMVPAFQLHFPNSPIGLFGFRRNKVTILPELYYENIPPISSDATVLLLDPMLATGGTAAAAINRLKARGVQEEKIIFVGILGLFQAGEVGTQTFFNVAKSVQEHALVLAAGTGRDRLRHGDLVAARRQARVQLHHARAADAPERR